ncbi:MAG: ADP-ribosylglycohydrolase family protein [Chloroflexi bacterium]|nr:ADP-ribosylglycohydrolase family protein [Chloroflexota bacterium]MDE2936112.1 ADP-ribosylglycohydrolase family protein [Chloroflexota bacterium]MXX65764.1 ADP-ribosylglycohydrolase family protein [Chloroflexota bacterium]MXX99907.1 ADP-ribosylglycohydrolase family protein [Chloroflexota bacterium]
MIDYTSHESLLGFEIAQLKEEGCDPVELSDRHNRLQKHGAADSEFEQLWSLAEALAGTGPLEDAEPSGLDQIQAARPNPRAQLGDLPADLGDAVAGAWLGRCAGCQLGKPVEGWPHWAIRRYLEPEYAFPPDDYIPLIPDHDVGIPLHQSAYEAARGNFSSMARDDDIDYMIFALANLERNGFDFAASDVAEAWLEGIPANMTYTAERVAYKNLMLGIAPPESATVRNPFREWIGAQIRTDVYGYACAGDPAAAAELAYRDAIVSHIKNGIYGALFAAAANAAAFATDDPLQALLAGMDQIPARSRLQRELESVIDSRERGLDWEQALAQVMSTCGHYHGVHTINNACFVAIGLLWGECDLEKSISIAVACGLDTDCNGATAGSIVGAILGARSLPTAWIDPLGDRVGSMVAGFDGSRISDLAERTHTLAKSR